MTPGASPLSSTSTSSSAMWTEFSGWLLKPDPIHGFRLERRRSGGTSLSDKSFSSRVLFFLFDDEEFSSGTTFSRLRRRSILSEGFGELGWFEGEGRKSWIAERDFEGDAIIRYFIRKGGKKESRNLLNKGGKSWIRVYFFLLWILESLRSVSRRKKNIGSFIGKGSRLPAETRKTGRLTGNVKEPFFMKDETKRLIGNSCQTVSRKLHQKTDRLN